MKSEDGLNGCRVCVCFCVSSPVIMITLMPACRHIRTALSTSFLGGSNMPTQPTKVRSDWEEMEVRRAGQVQLLHFSSDIALSLSVNARVLSDL